MNILWITNIALPPVCEDLGWPVPAVGGWMHSSLKLIKGIAENKFAVATVYNGKEVIKREIDGVRYYLLPLCGKSHIRYNKGLETYWKQVSEELKPDVVHIHGSEYPHGLAYVKACGSKNVVVSLQGIISSYARYYTGSLSRNEIIKSITFRDFIKGGIYKAQKEFIFRGKLEKELLRTVDHIIGRTDWDKAHAWAINPNAQYHYCGETLRDSFYLNKWHYSNCEPHTIFVSQANYPIKGLHKLLEAIPLVLRQYPDTKVYVAGSDKNAKPWYRLTGYGKYLKKLIKKNKLEQHVFFTGVLNEQQMCQRYIDSNLFVCCSAIENSPNSLGEAQMLGMPYLATFAGGIPEIVNYNSDVLYRFEEHEMLAKKICIFFGMKSNLNTLEFDRKRYDMNINSQLLIDIYKKIGSE